MKLNISIQNMCIEYFQYKIENKKISKEIIRVRKEIYLRQKQSKTIISKVTKQTIPVNLPFVF